MKKLILILSISGMFLSCKKEVLPQLENANNDLQKNASGTTKIDKITVTGPAPNNEALGYYDFVYNNGKLDKINVVDKESKLQVTMSYIYNSNGRLIKVKRQTPINDIENFEHNYLYYANGKLSSMEDVFIYNSPRDLPILNNMNYNNGKLISNLSTLIPESTPFGELIGYTFFKTELKYSSIGNVLTSRESKYATANNAYSYGNVAYIDSIQYSYNLQYDNPFKTMNHPLQSKDVLEHFKFLNPMYPQSMNFVKTIKSYLVDGLSQMNKIYKEETFTVLASQGRLPTLVKVELKAANLNKEYTLGFSYTEF